MIARENTGAHRVHAGGMASLPGGQPFDQLLQPSQRPDRLGQLRLTSGGGGGGLGIGTGQIGQQSAELGQGAHGYGHLACTFGCGMKLFAPIHTPKTAGNH